VAGDQHARPIPGQTGPLGAFAEGKCKSEFEARQRVETHWSKFLTPETP
jgi:hypothetical protein